MVKDAPSKMGKFFFNLRMKTVNSMRSIEIDFSDVASEKQYCSVRTADLGYQSPNKLNKMVVPI